jgi:hypothetical protein
MFEPTAYNFLIQELKADGLTDKEIEAKLYYDFAYFRMRVPRIVPPPSQHYHRVRAVFAFYGQQRDIKTGAPLFNDAAWGRAKNLLLEILAGFYADPPGMEFYFQAVNAKGEPAFDEHGIPLLVCNRGTSDVECFHRSIMETFSKWCTCVHMADCLLTEHRHRYNHHISELRRTGFPRFGHCDTWLIDLLQLVVEFNHNVLLHPAWPNTADYAATAESFGTVRIHSPELDIALQRISLPPNITKKFTQTQKYMCKRMGIPVPVLPVHGEAECFLFDKLVRSSHTNADYDQMAIDWCKSVNGVNIHAKLPSQLRTHHSAWQHNQGVRQAVQSAAAGETLLTRINNETMWAYLPSANMSSPPSQPPSPPAAPSSSPPLLSPPVPRPFTGGAPAPGGVLGVEVACATTEPAAMRAEMPPAATPFAQHPPLASAAHPPLDDTAVLVGGIGVSLQPAQQDSSAPLKKRERGHRKGDKLGKGTRNGRTCRTCKANNRPEEAKDCPGRASGGKCRVCKTCEANNRPEEAKDCPGRASGGKCNFPLQMPPV